MNIYSAVIDFNTFLFNHIINETISEVKVNVFGRERSYEGIMKRSISWRDKIVVNQTSTMNCNNSSQPTERRALATKETATSRCLTDG